MTVSMQRILAAMYPPENTGALVVLAAAIVDETDGHTHEKAPRATQATPSRPDASELSEATNMSWSMASLLLHDEQVPAEARDALRAAYDAPPAQRSASLESAARVLHEVTGLGCSDVRELVGLAGGDCP